MNKTVAWSSLSFTMAGKDTEKEAGFDARVGEDVALGVDDAGAIPKGTIDPVYEAKARVLNRAVREQAIYWRPSLPLPDPGHWDGMVSMAALHCHWIRMGFR
jgi:hypothetical protein